MTFTPLALEGRRPIIEMVYLMTESGLATILEGNGYQAFWGHQLFVKENELARPVMETIFLVMSHRDVSLAVRYLVIVWRSRPFTKRLVKGRLRQTSFTWASVASPTLLVFDRDFA